MHDLHLDLGRRELQQRLGQCLLRTLHVGPDTLLVAAKVAVPHDETAASVAAGINAAERRIRAAVPIAELIFLEPDIYQAGRVDLSDPAVKAARRRARPPAGQQPGD